MARRARHERHPPAAARADKCSDVRGSHGVTRTAIEQAHHRERTARKVGWEGVVATHSGQLGHAARDESRAQHGPSRDLAPRRIIFCGASKAGSSNDDGSSAMIADMSLNATSWRRRRRSATLLRSSQSSPHAPFLKCGLFACSALNARSNDCHVGLLCMTQRAQYRTQMWVRTLCVVVRTDFLCYPVHFQHKKLNSPWRCSRVPVRADPLRVPRPRHGPVPLVVRSHTALSRFLQQNERGESLPAKRAPPLLCLSWPRQSE